MVYYYNQRKRIKNSLTGNVILKDKKMRLAKQVGRIFYGEKNERVYSRNNLLSEMP